MTKFSPVAFDSGAKCPRFDQFMHEVFSGDEDLIRYVQGRRLHADGQHPGAVPVCLLGGRQQRKSKLFGVLGFIFGDYAADLPFSALELKPGVIGEDMNLPGARLAKAVEIREGRWLDEARIKAWTGSDRIVVRPLYHHAFSFQPTHKIWIAVNHRPLIADESHAMWRRMRLIPFLRRFEGEEKDPHLLEKLTAEASGILNWAIAGCLAWLREGLEPPMSVQEATREYQRESDTIGQFLDECCVIRPDLSVTSAALWEAFQEWCRSNGEKPLTRRAFADRLKNRRFSSAKTGHQRDRVWHGLCLAQQPPTSWQFQIVDD